MFDVDEHPKLVPALELAAANSISVSVSNPCIELWFLLHFQDQNAVIDRHHAQRAAAEYLSRGKTPTADALAALTSQYEQARRRAQALSRKHELDGSPRGANPSSEVWRLIEAIRHTG